MKHFAKIALGALMVAGAATAVATQPAEARVSVGIGIGGPAYYGPPARYTSCDPYSRYYDPYRCAPAYYDYGPSYYGPGYGPGFGSLYLGFGGGHDYHGGGRGGFHGGGGHGGGSHGGGGHHR